MVFDSATAPTISAGTGSTMTNGGSYLVAGKINWKSAGTPDELFIFNVTDLDTEPAEGTAVSSANLDLNQEDFLYLSMSDHFDASVDEIRFGNTFEDVMGDRSRPTLGSSNIVDDWGGGPTYVNALVTYSLSFSEDIDASTVTSADFSNAGNATIEFFSISETSSGNFTVKLKPTSAGTLQLQVNSGAVIQDVLTVKMDTSSAIVDNTEITVLPDAYGPILVSITDDQGGAAVAVGTMITYTLTFSEDVDDSTVSAADFENGDNASITVGTITETSPGVFTVQVTPTSAGLLTFQVAAGATIEDTLGYATDTTYALPDDNAIVVETVLAEYQFDGGSYASSDTETNSSANSMSNGAGITLATASDFGGDPAAPALETYYGQIPGTLASSISNNDYYVFTMTPDSGKRMSFSKLELNVINSGGKTLDLWMLTSQDGFLEANLVAQTSMPSSTETWTSTSIDLSSMDENVIISTEFRLYLGDNNASTGSHEVRLDSIVLKGATADADLTAPLPATMSFAVNPRAASGTSITMTATTATDASGVEYYFDETSGFGNDSGWQTSPIYTDTDLVPGVIYTYTVQARDRSIFNNTNTVSPPASSTVVLPMGTIFLIE